MAKLSLLFCLILSASAIVSVSATSEEVGIYEIKKGSFSVKLTNFGATVLSVILPDKTGKQDDVVLSYAYDSLASYHNDTTYFGNIVGRVANRIGGAQFTLDGVHYNVDANEEKNMLHGGHKGFSEVVWTVTKHVKEGLFPYIVFTYHSFDGEEGFPGDLPISVTYAIVGERKLIVFMGARALDKATPVNLASHTYWNLGGHDSGDILSHHVQIYGSHITPVDEELIPTGEILAVNGTPYDFLEPQTVGSRIDQLPGGYDINYVLDEDIPLRKAAKVYDSKSGRVLELWTNKPGLQFYSGNKVTVEKGKDGAVYKIHCGLALETQGFPDAVNHPNFPSQIVYPGMPYFHIMVYKFSTTT